MVTIGGVGIPTATVGAFGAGAVRALANRSPAPLTAIVTAKAAMANPNFDRPGFAQATTPGKFSTDSTSEE